MRMWLVAMVVLSACQRHSPTCESAVSGAIDRMIEDAKGHMPPAAAQNMARVVPQMKKVLTAACTEDKWAAPVIKCIDGARTRGQLDACDAQLTPEQRASERKRQDEILKAAVQPLDIPMAKGHERPDPHAGMDMGSAH